MTSDGGRARDEQSVFTSTTVADVLRLANRPAPVKGYFRCPAHADSGRKNAHVSRDGRAWYCHRCNARGGVAELVIAFGHARDRAGAARWLEARRAVR